MDYDNNAFLAGLAVGRRLKGWACGGDLSIGISGSGGSSDNSVLNVSPLLLDFLDVIPVLAYSQPMENLIQMDSLDVIPVLTYSEV